MTIKRAAVGYIIFMGLAAAQGAYYYSQLPQRVASHFNAAGQPDGWMDKETMVWLSIGFIAGMSVMWLGIGTLLKCTPVSLINLPNKDYWLAPERRDWTFAAISADFARFGYVLCSFLLILFEMAYRANLRTEPRLSNAVWLLLAGFLVFSLIWTVKFYLYFRRPAGDDGTGAL